MVSLSAFLHCHVGHSLGHSGLLQSQGGSPICIPAPRSLHLTHTICAPVQGSPSSPGRWVNTWSASRRTAATWPTAPCPSWWSSPRLGMHAEPKSMAGACRRAGHSRCLNSSWTHGMQVCGVAPGERLAGMVAFLLRLLCLFIPPPALSF